MEAVNLLEEMVQDFPFESQADKANALGSAFEQLVREMIDGGCHSIWSRHRLPAAVKDCL